jgi:hypothetical protein
MRALTALVLLAVVSLSLAACGGSPSPAPTQPPQPPPASTQPGSNQSPAATQSGAVTGTVSWPDGNLAVNADVYFYNFQPTVLGNGWSGDYTDGYYAVVSVQNDGTYSLTGCPCADLSAYLYIPGVAGEDPLNGGQDCWTIMADGNDNYSGRPANPGDVIDYQALDMPCANTWYSSDQQAAQSEAQVLNEAEQSGENGAVGRHVAAAEQRVSGT